MFGVDLTPLFRLIQILLVLCVLFGGYGIYSTIKTHRNKEIRSNKRLSPKVELTVKNNKIDTIFVYKK